MTTRVSGEGALDDHKVLGNFDLLIFTSILVHGTDLRKDPILALLPLINRFSNVILLVVSMIQIAFLADDGKIKCFLFRICNFQNFQLPKMLRKFFQRKSTTKIICSKITPSASDFRKLSSSFNIDATRNCGFVSLQDFAVSKGITGISLKKLAEYFRFPYNDLPFHYHGFWEDSVLPDESMLFEYAADDATLCLLIYNKLTALPTITPPPVASGIGKAKTLASSGEPANPKSVFPCNEQIKNGRCQKENCPYSHSVLKCDLCNVLATSQVGYLRHLNGRKHKDAVKAEGKAPTATQFACMNCSKYFAHQAALKYHYSSREHSKMQRAIQFGNAKVLAQSDKEGVCFHCDATIDFGAIEVIGKEADLAFKLENTSSSVVTLLGFASSPKSASSSVATVAVSSSSMTIAAKSSIIVTLTCTAIQFGHFQTELDFQFSRGGQKTVISITRTLVAFIGDNQLYQDLKPKQPYQRRKIQASITQNGFVPADKISELDGTFNINKYVVQLPWYDIPPKVKEAVFASSAGKTMPVHKQFALDFFKDPMTLGSYKAFHSNLLYAEESQMELDILRYSMFGVSLKMKTGIQPTYELDVPGLAEARPSVLKGDSVFVKQSGSKKKPFEGRATEIRNNSVVFKFSQAFDRSFLNGQRFDVQFKYNRIPWRRMQFAVEQVNDITDWDKMYRSSLASQKVQEKAKSFKALQACPPSTWNPFNKLIAQNPEQCRAVTTIVTGSHRPFPFLLFGPPVG